MDEEMKKKYELPYSFMKKNGKYISTPLIDYRNKIDRKWEVWSYKGYYYYYNCLLKSDFDEEKPNDDFTPAKVESKSFPGIDIVFLGIRTFILMGVFWGFIIMMVFGLLRFIFLGY